MVGQAASIEIQRRDSDEAELVSAARRGDPQAWSRIFRENFEPIARYAFYRVHDKEAAEELASQVIEAALKGIGRFDYRGISIRAWLFRIAGNKTADYLRKRSRETREPKLEVADSRDQMASAGLRMDLLQAIGKLNDNQQQVIILRFLQGLSPTETAEVVGRTESAVATTQSRALKALRKVLNGEEAG